MKKFTAIFNGRQVGAIGTFGEFKIEIEASDREAARLKIYDTHEHIQNLNLIAH